MASFDTPFSDETVSRNYARYRPHYPEALQTQIIIFHREKGNVTDLAVDVGCGTGISTCWLGEYFTRVIGVDPSGSQLENADHLSSNVEYKIGEGQNLYFLTDNSVDLLTIAAAIHYVNEKRFFEEVARVLKPGGTFAVYGQVVPVICDEMEMKEIFRNFTETHIYSYLEERQRSIIVSMYKNLVLPFKDQTRFEYTSSKEISLDDLCGFIKSTGPYTKLVRNQPTALSTFHSRMLEAYKSIHGKSDNNPTLKIQTPFFMYLTRK